MAVKQAPYFVEYYRTYPGESCDLSMGLSSLIAAKEHGQDVSYQHKYTAFRVLKKTKDNQILNAGFWSNTTGRWRKIAGYGFAP